MVYAVQPSAVAAACHALAHEAPDEGAQSKSCAQGKCKADDDSWHSPAASLILSTARELNRTAQAASLAVQEGEAGQCKD